MREKSQRQNTAMETTRGLRTNTFTSVSLVASAGRKHLASLPPGNVQPPMFFLLSFLSRNFFYVCEPPKASIERCSIEETSP